MKILVLMHEDLVPPDEAPSLDVWERASWKTEFDVLKGLRQLGHEVLPLGVSYDLGPVRRAIFEFKPNIVFNLLEEFAGEAVFDQNVVSYLEMIGQKYTGCNPRGLILARDKALAKKILKYHRIPTPDFFVFFKGRKPKTVKGHQFPLFVKALNEEASLGITQDSIVYNAEELKERIEYFHDKISTDVIAESYIEGRELYVGVVGNERLACLPTWELHFEKASERTPRIATRKVKWDMSYRKKLGISTGPAKSLSTTVESQLDKISRRSYQVLSLSGYARMDLRLNSKGEAYLIEANPNPDIGFREDLSASAEDYGWAYPQLLKRLLNLGLSWEPLKAYRSI